LNMHGAGWDRLMLSHKQEATPFRQVAASSPVLVGGVWSAFFCPRMTLEADQCASAEASSRRVVEDQLRPVESASGGPFRHERTASGVLLRLGECASGVLIRTEKSVPEAPPLLAIAPTSSPTASTSSAAGILRRGLPLPALVVGPPLSSVGRASSCSLARRLETWRCCRSGRSRIGRGRSAAAEVEEDGPLAGQRFPHAEVGASWVFRGREST
jgi:hypothetical protein